MHPQFLLAVDAIEYYSTVQLTPEGTKVLTIAQSEKKSRNATASLIAGIGSVHGTLLRSIGRGQGEKQKIE